MISNCTVDGRSNRDDKRISCPGLKGKGDTTLLRLRVRPAAGRSVNSRLMEARWISARVQRRKGPTVVDTPEKKNVLFLCPVWACARELHMTPRPVALVYCFEFGPFFSAVTRAFCPTLDFTAGKSSLKKKCCPRKFHINP